MRQEEFYNKSVFRKKKKEFCHKIERKENDIHFQTTQTEQQTIATPPFWIDMSKLFELYVFSKLRTEFKGKNEVVYHFTSYSKEIDFLINGFWQGKPLKMVVDTKYKPRYENSSVDLADYRQVSAYARMKSVYKELGFDKDSNEIIDCLIIYPVIGNEQEIDLSKKEESHEYVRFYKLAIGMPITLE